MAAMHPIRHLIHGDADIFAGIEPAKTVRAFTDTGILYEHIRKRRDIELACEIGSWAGYSAMSFVGHFTGHLVCVDTWLGSSEHWIDRDLPQHEMNMRNGRPTLYEEFMSTAANFADRITPLPQTSKVAAEILQEFGVEFDLIYVDGDHSFDGVVEDIENYLPLLAPGGIIAGDDYGDSRFKVKDAVNASFNPKDVEILQNNFWIWYNDK